MKIWYGYSSEHSTGMTIVASFKDAESFEEAMKKLKDRNAITKYPSKERESLYSVFAKRFWDDDTIVPCKDNKILISTDSYIYTALIELLLAEGADEIKLADESCPIENNVLDTPDLRNEAAKLGYCLDDMGDDFEEHSSENA